MGPGIVNNKFIWSPKKSISIWSKILKLSKNTKGTSCELILIFPNVSCTHMSPPTILTTVVDESFENFEIFEKHMLRLLFVELIRRNSFDEAHSTKVFDPPHTNSNIVIL